MTIVVLDYEIGAVIEIEPTEEEEKMLEDCFNAEEFFDKTFDKYRIDSSNSRWMFCNTLHHINYKDGKEVTIK